MPQLHVYVPDKMADALKYKASAQNLSVSKYLATLITKDIGTSWPEGYFESVVGAWQGEALTRPEQEMFQERENF